MPSQRIIHIQRLFFVALFLAGALGQESHQIQIMPLEAKKGLVKKLGDPTVVTCVSPNATDINWTKLPNKKISSTKGRVHTERKKELDSHFALVFEHIERDDKGNYSCSSKINGVEHTSQFQLIVLRPITFPATPQVQRLRENQNGLVTCNVEGDPDPQIAWHVKGKPLKEDDPNPKYKYVTSGLLIQNVSLDDKGEYLCKAFQSSEIATGMQDHLITVKIEHKPIIREPAGGSTLAYGYLSGQVNLTCHIEAEPDATVYWKKKKKLIKDDQQGIVILNSPPHSILQISILDKDAFESYECHGNNSLGSVTARFDLREGARALPPANVNLESPGHFSVNIKVEETETRGQFSSGTAEQILPVEGYRVTYSSGQGEWESVDFKKDSELVLQDLKSDTEYKLRVATRNAAGLSEYSKDLKFHTLKFLKNSSPGITHFVSSSLWLASIVAWLRLFGGS